MLAVLSLIYFMRLGKDGGRILSPSLGDVVVCRLWHRVVVMAGGPVRSGPYAEVTVNYIPPVRDKECAQSRILKKNGNLYGE